jgi:hypothetical protein
MQLVCAISLLNLVLVEAPYYSLVAMMGTILYVD